MTEADIRLQQLSAKVVAGDMTDEEFAEMAELSRAKKKQREERAVVVAGVRETILSLGLTIHDVFTESEILAAGPQTNWYRTGSAGRVRPGQNPGAEGTKTSGVPGFRRTRATGDTWVRQKTGVVLVEIALENANGLPCRYCKGQTLPFYIAKSLKALDTGDVAALETNLRRYFTAVGTVYFASEEGQQELTRLINYIRKHKVKPTARELPVGAT